MSVIAAVTKNSRTVIAADTLTCFGESQRVSADNSHTPKVRRVGGALVGAAGWGVYDNILDHFLVDQRRPDLSSERAIFTFFLALWKALHETYPFVNDQSQGRDSPFGDLDASFLVASPEGIFKVSSDLDICRFEKYYAIGSGAEYALGAMHQIYDQLSEADEIARRSVASAIEFDLHCGGDVTVLAVEPGW